MKNNDSRIKQITKAIKEIEEIREHLDLEEEHNFLMELNEFIFKLIHNYQPNNSKYPSKKTNTFLLISGEVEGHSEAFFSVKVEDFKEYDSVKLKKEALKRINHEFIFDNKLKNSDINWGKCTSDRIEGYATLPDSEANFSFVFFINRGIIYGLNDYTRTG